MTLFDYLQENKELSQFDLAHLADWAESLCGEGTGPLWEEAYRLLATAADLLNRRMSMSSGTPPVHSSGQKE